MFEELYQCYIAGGAITSYATNKPVNDYDVYPKNYEGLEAALEYGFSKGNLVHISDRAATFMLYERDYTSKRIPFQVITFDYFENTEKLFNTFDFTICMGAYCCDTKEYIFHSDFLLHNSQRTLIYNTNAPWPLSSLLRVQKYAKRGYEMKSHERLKLALSVKMPTSWKNLKDQIGGIYGETIKIDETQEFTEENIFKSLENAELVVLDNISEKIEEYTNYYLEYLLAVLDKSPKKYCKINNTTLVWDEKSFLTLPQQVSIHEHWTQVDKKHYKLRTFKRLNEGNGHFISAHNPDFKYYEGEIAVEKRSPYLYAGKGYYAGDYIVQVETKLSKIKSISRNGVVQTTELYVLPGSTQKYTDNNKYKMEVLADE